MRRSRPAITTTQRWGNSLAVRIPKPLAQAAHLKFGTTVEIRFTTVGLLIRPVRRQRRYTLRQLLTSCAGKTPPAEIDWGKPAGGEVW